MPRQLNQMQPPVESDLLALVASFKIASIQIVGQPELFLLAF